MCYNNPMKDEEKLQLVVARVMTAGINTLMGLIMACFVCGLVLEDEAWVIWAGTLIGMPFLFGYFTVMWPMPKELNNE